MSPPGKKKKVTGEGAPRDANNEPYRNNTPADIEAAIRAARRTIRPGATWTNWKRPRPKEDGSVIEVDLFVDRQISRKRDAVGRRSRDELRRVSIDCPYWYARIAVVNAAVEALISTGSDRENVDEDQDSKDGPSTIMSKAGAIRTSLETFLSRTTCSALVDGRDRGSAETTWDEKDRTAEIVENALSQLQQAIDALIQIETVAGEAATAKRRTKRTFFQDWSVNFVDHMSVAWERLTGQAPSKGVFEQFIAAGGHLLGLYEKNWDNHVRVAIARSSARKNTITARFLESQPLKPYEYEALQQYRDTEEAIRGQSERNKILLRLRELMSSQSIRPSVENEIKSLIRMLNRKRSDEQVRIAGILKRASLQ